MLEKHTIISPIDGPKLLVLGAIHGNETAGTSACMRLFEEFQQQKFELLKGSLTLMPVCNPQAFLKETRFIDENLNRVIKKYNHPTSYEQTLANEIADAIAAAEIVLDLHSTHCADDKPFAFLDYPHPLASKLISTLPLGYILEGWPEIYADNPAINDYSTQRYAYDNGSLGITIECGYHFAPVAAEVAYQSIINSMQTLDMLSGKAKITPHQQTIVMKNYIIKDKEGQLSKNYSHLDKIAQGEIIANYDDGSNITAPNDCYILIPNHEAIIGNEWFYLGCLKLT